MKTTSATHIILLAFIISLLSIFVFQETLANSIDDDVKYLSELKEKREQEITIMEKDARVVLALTLSIGLLGIIISFLQAFNFNFKKTVIAISGLLVSGITYVNVTLYKVDHFTLEKAISNSKVIMEDLGSYFLSPPQDEETFEVWKEAVVEKLKKVSQIRTSLYAYNSSFSFQVHMPNLLHCPIGLEIRHKINFTYILSVVLRTNHFAPQKTFH